jgi:hypothetical protein
MAQPVWVLSVDLQTKTATFQSGMSDAAKAARGSFNEIKAGADEMGRATGGSMMEARHGVMLLGEEFGVHLPRALTSFIASIGPVGAAMEAAFPFLAVVVGATLLLEHLAKLKAEGQALTTSQVNFGTAVANVLNGLDQKLLEAGIRTDELNHNHLGALHKQLELIDRTSMNDLVQAFGVVSKAADVTFAQLKTSWYQWGAGSAGAKSALEQFKAQYDSLLAQGKDKEANDLLAGTRQSAERVLELQKQVRDNQSQTGTQGGHHGDYAKFEQAKNDLKKQGIGYTEKEVEAQQILVDSLRAQVSVQEKVNELKTAQKTNATASTQDKIGSDDDKVAREQAQNQKIAMEEADKAWEENYRNAVARLQENEREKIENTKAGSAARLAAIDAAIKEEESKGLQETSGYRSLCQSKVRLTAEMIEEQKKLEAEAGKESAEHAVKMGELKVASDKDAANLRLSAMRNSENARVQSEIQLANETYAVQRDGNSKQIAALDKTTNDYQNKLKALQDKELELTREHENQLTAIKEKAEEDRNRRILSAENQFDDAIVHSAMKILTTHKSIASIMRGLGDQVAEGLMQNAMKAILADDMTKPHDAAAAARKAYLAGMQFPFPANIVMGPALGAMAFASVMAFETGGLVPGVANFDSVNAKLTPGEAVLPKKLTENLTHAARGNNNGPDIHINHSPTYNVQTIDGDGIKGVLEKHDDQFKSHVEHHLRKMNN